MKVKDLVKRWGSIPRAAQALSTSPQLVRYWEKHGIPLARQYQVESLSSGALKVSKSAKQKCQACGKLRQFHGNFCPDCSAIYNKIKGRCHAKVLQAIKSGDLRSPKGLKCVSCGGVADRYDHRDYSKPLKVDAVCHPCDYRRGTPRSALKLLRAAVKQKP